MKVYIMADFEGVAGFIEWDDYSWDTPMGQEKRSRLRKIYTGEVNAAIEGALAAGAAEVLVWDSHGPDNNCNNLYFEDLNPAAELIIGWKGLPSFYPLLDGSFNAGIYIGGHAMAGSAHAVVPHTRWNLNGHDIGEVGMFMAMCGFFKVPSVFISGDRTTVEQVKDFVPGMQHVITKESFSPYAAKTLIPAKARQLIKKGVKKALENRRRVPPWKLGPPYTFVFEDKKKREKMSGNDLFELFNVKILNEKFGIKFGTQDVQPQLGIFVENNKKGLRYRYWERVKT